MKNVLIVGGGASGMAAAFAAASSGAAVTLLEKKEIPGKKLSVTGNGHGNISNTDLSDRYYRASDGAFLKRFLERFDREAAAAFFSKLGLLTTEKAGGIYPRTNQAQTVTAALTESLKRLSVTCITECDVTDVIPEGGAYRIVSDRGSYRAEAVILACGSEASVRDRHPFSAYGILKKLGIRVSDILPALVPLYGHNGAEKLWQGIRTTASVSFGDRTETGELQLTDKGISGIPVFQLSVDAVRKIRADGSLDLTVDFLPEYTSEALTGLIGQAAAELPAAETEVVMRGWFPKKLIPVLLYQAKLSGRRLISSLTGGEIEALVTAVKAYRYTVTGYGAVEEAQTVRGGVDLGELTDCFESKTCPGLYIVGELCDVTGCCGGYNLTFAFGSGLIAGAAAGGNMT